jgi:hypothetical protein
MSERGHRAVQPDAAGRRLGGRRRTHRAPGPPWRRCGGRRVPLTGAVLALAAGMSSHVTERRPKTRSRRTTPGGRLPPHALGPRRVVDELPRGAPLAPALGDASSNSSSARPSSISGRISERRFLGATQVAARSWCQAPAAPTCSQNSRVQVVRAPAGPRRAPDTALTQEQPAWRVVAEGPKRVLSRSQDQGCSKPRMRLRSAVRRQFLMLRRRLSDVFKVRWVAADGSAERFAEGARRLWEFRRSRGHLFGHLRPYAESAHWPDAGIARWVKLMEEVNNG